MQHTVEGGQCHQQPGDERCCFRIANSASLILVDSLNEAGAVRDVKQFCVSDELHRQTIMYYC